MNGLKLFQIITQYMRKNYIDLATFIFIALMR